MTTTTTRPPKSPLQVQRLGDAGEPQRSAPRVAFGCRMGCLYQGRTQIAKKRYEAAATLAARGGFLHDCALAHERYGVMYLESFTISKGPS
jgi:hypothetical protein